MPVNTHTSKLLDGWMEGRAAGWMREKRNFIADENGRGLQNKNNACRLNSQERPFARCPDASAAPCWLRAPLYGRRRWNFSNLCGSSRLADIEIVQPEVIFF
jgi:hypothetical protein